MVLLCFLKYIDKILDLAFVLGKSRSAKDQRETQQRMYTNMYLCK